MNGPIIVANEPLDSCGGIQRYLTRLERELRLIYGTATVIEPLGKSSVAFDTLSLLNAYARAVFRRRPSFTIASVWFPTGLVVAILPKWFRGSLAILAHGSEISAPGPLRRILMKFTYSRASAIFANSEFVRGILRDVGVSKRVYVVPCGVDQSSARLPPAQHPIILTVGRLIERKGFDVTIMAMPAILAAMPNAVLEIVGDGAFKETLRSLAEKLNVANAVVFRGYIDDPELELAYRRATCFVLPTRRIGNDVEGFGIVYLEAASAGLPTIGGTESGAAEAIEDGVTGLLVDGRNSAAVAEAVISLLSDPISARIMGERGRERALHHFSWNRTARLIDDVMR